MILHHGVDEFDVESFGVLLLFLEGGLGSFVGGGGAVGGAEQGFA